MDHIFVRTLHYDLSILGGPAKLIYCFIELCQSLNHDKAAIYEGEEYITKHLIINDTNYLDWWTLSISDTTSLIIVILIVITSI